MLIDSWGCGEIQENGVEVLIKVFSTCTYCACFPSIVSWTSQEAGPFSKRGCLKSTSKIFSWEVDAEFINKSTLRQRPSVLIASLKSPLHLPPCLWIHPAKDKPPALPAKGFALQQWCWIPIPPVPSPYNSPLRTLYSRLKLSLFRNNYSAILTSLQNKKTKKKQDVLFKAPATKKKKPHTKKK